MNKEVKQINKVAEVLENITAAIGINNINKCCVWLFGQQKLNKSLDQYKKHDKSI